MAPAAREKIQSILTFVAHLQQNLDQAPSLHADLLSDLSSHLGILPVASGDVPSDLREEIKTSAVSLWNDCNKNDNIKHVDDKLRNYVAQVRALSFLLLESIVRRDIYEKSFSQENTSNDNTKSSMSTVHETHFSLGNETVRRCLAAHDTGLALKITEIMAKRYSVCLDGTVRTYENVESRSELAAEYMCLRLALEWKRKRLDLARHWDSRLQQLMNDVNQASSSMTTRWVDLLYEIGIDELSQSHFENAVLWLRRAREVLGATEDRTSLADTDDMRLNVLHAYARSLSGIVDPDTGEDETIIVQQLKNEYGDKLPIVLLQLELSSKHSKSDPEIFSQLLSSIVRSMHLIEANHKLILFYTHKLFAISPAHAIKCIRQYILRRLVHHGDDNWTERAIVTYTWMLISCEATQVNEDPVTLLNTSFDAFASSWHKTLSPEAAQAILTLFWKLADRCNGTVSFSVLEFSQLLQHTLFKQVSDLQIGQMERKAINTCLIQQDYANAQAIIHSMPVQRRTHHLTQYLGYCMALRTNDKEGAVSALSVIITMSTQNSTLLLACVGQTMQHGNRVDSLRLLQRILDKYSSSASTAVDIPTLLRCTTRILFSIADNSVIDEEEFMTRLFSALRTGYSLPPGSVERSSCHVLTLVDCLWFEKHSYNLAVTKLKVWPNKSVIDLLEYSNQIHHARLSRSGLSGCVAENVEHGFIVIYIQAILYTTEARKYQSVRNPNDLPRTSFSIREKPDPLQIQNLLYKNVFERYLKLLQAYEVRDNNISQRQTVQWQSWLCQVIPLAFEAVLVMSCNPVGAEGKIAIPDELNLGQIIDIATRIGAPPRTYGIIADLIICAALDGIPPVIEPKQASEPLTPIVIPLSPAIKLISKLIQAVRNLQVYDITQAARWIRCIVQLILDHSQHNPKHDPPHSQALITTHISQTKLSLLITIIDQALYLARSTIQNQPTHHPPTQPTPPNPATTSTTTIPSPPSPYPSTELNHLSTTLFNTSIDLYLSNQESQAQHLAAKAIEIADVLASLAPANVGHDRDTLAKTLRGKVSSLGWSL